MNKAMAFNMNITPNDTAISFSFALTTGPTAAIALPPQIAVPEEIRYDVLRFILSQCPINTPIIITPKTDAIVKSIPSLPDFNDSLTFMLNPRPTTEACNRYLEVFLLNLGYGFLKIRAYTNPINNAIAGEILFPMPS